MRESDREAALGELTSRLARLSGWSESCNQITPGGSQALVQVLAALTDVGDTVVVERPTYEPILASLRFLGLKFVEFERTCDFSCTMRTNSDGFQLCFRI